MKRLWLVTFAVLLVFVAGSCASTVYVYGPASPLETTAFAYISEANMYRVEIHLPAEMQADYGIPGFNMSGWTICDAKGNELLAIPDGSEIEAGGYVAFSWDKAPEPITSLILFAEDNIVVDRFNIKFDASNVDFVVRAMSEPGRSYTEWDISQQRMNDHPGITIIGPWTFGERNLA